MTNNAEELLTFASLKIVLKILITVMHKAVVSGVTNTVRGHKTSEANQTLFISHLPLLKSKSNREQFSITFMSKSRHKHLQSSFMLESMLSTSLPLCPSQSANASYLLLSFAKAQIPLISRYDQVIIQLPLISLCAPVKAQTLPISLYVQVKSSNTSHLLFHPDQN